MNALITVRFADVKIATYKLITMITPGLMISFGYAPNVMVGFIVNALCVKQQ